MEIPDEVINASPYGIAQAFREAPIHGERVDCSISIARPAQEIYEFWRKTENLPLFMRRLESIETLPNGHSFWTWRTIASFEAQWEAEIIEDQPGKMISWRTVEDSPIQHAGSVWFRAERAGSAAKPSTEVRVQMIFGMPGGAIAEWFASLFGESPEQVVDEDLRRLRALLEGEELGLEGEEEEIEEKADGPSESLAALGAASPPLI